MTNGARVLLADGDPATRAGVRLALEAGGLQVCHEAVTGWDAVSAASRELPDICLVDVLLPGNGIYAARTIVERVPDTVVVMLTSSPSEDDLFAALRAGACGYLSKEIDPRRLLQAIEGVLAGEAAFPRRLVARVVEEFRGLRETHRIMLSSGRAATLTDREWDVLRMLRDGLSTAEIAERMFVAPVTVRTHVAAILRKLRVPDRAAAVELLGR